MARNVPARPLDPPADPINLIQARDRYGIAIPSLRALVEKRSLRYRERRPHGRGESIVFDQKELAADLAALPRCQAPGCQEPGTGPSGYCGKHYGHGGRQRAHKAELDLIGSERDWYTFREAWKRAGCSSGTLSKAIKAGEVPATRVGRHTRIPKADLHRWDEGRSEGRRVTAKRPTPRQREARRERVAALHAEEKSPGVIADKIGCSKPTVFEDLRVLGLSRRGEGRRARVLPPGKRLDREQRTAELYRSGKSLREVATELGSSPTQVRRDLASQGVEIRPTGSHPKYPEPAERRCLHCGEPFTPKFPSLDFANGPDKPRKFCSDDCGHEWRVEQGKSALRERGLLSVSEAAQQLRIGEHRVGVHINERRLCAELIPYPGMLKPVYGIRPEEIRRFRREWAKGGDGRRAALLDPDNAVARAEREGRISRFAEEKGLSDEKAADLFRLDAERRRSEYAKSRRGRKRRDGPSPLYLRWTALFNRMLTELQEAQAEDRLDGIESLRTMAYEGAAEVDWREHPENWSREKYPASPDDSEGLRDDFLNAAGDRLRKGIEALQKARK